VAVPIAHTNASTAALNQDIKHHNVIKGANGGVSEDVESVVSKLEAYA
jgi:hypothetical protein